MDEESNVREIIEDKLKNKGLKFASAVAVDGAFRAAYVIEDSIVIELSDQFAYFIDRDGKKRLRHKWRKI